ncbi:MAG TPA: AmmeMemoRadiSam system protein B [Phycisphaerae bacterium]|nr:AmmeMemoRadiSam system protein B [Phycisphaerae bacterium]
MRADKMLSRAVTMMAVGLPAACQGAAEQGPTTRPACCAGTWYPGDPASLAKYVDDLLGKAALPKIDGKPLAVIVPHAGYRFSAPVAATAYRALQDQAYRRVLLLAFSHRYAGAYDGVVVPTEWSAYETPLGTIPLDREAIAKLKGLRPFVSHAGVDRDEHSLELQLPFLQRVLKEFKLVPLLVGRMSPEDHAAAAEALLPLLGDDVLVVASSDFTHYGPNYGYVPFKDDVEKKLTELADQAARPLLNCDFDGFADHLKKTEDTICGHGPILLLLRVLSMRAGAVAVRSGFDTSGRMTGDWANSVTYQAFVFAPRPHTLDEKSRQELLRLARETVTSYITEHKVPTYDAAGLPAEVREDGMCFVTLQNHGELRGCIGNMEPHGPLWEAVVQNAVNACRDPRFTMNPVTPAELKDIDIEISRLTPMKPLNSTDEVVIGRDGLLIELGASRGVLLPQVAYERGWTREQFLGQVCRKAGLPPDAWRRPEAKLYSYMADVFGERESASQPATDAR